MRAMQALAPSRARAAALGATALAATLIRPVGLPLLEAARLGLRRVARQRYRAALRRAARVRAGLRDTLTRFL